MSMIINPFKQLKWNMFKNITVALIALSCISCNNDMADSMMSEQVANVSPKTNDESISGFRPVWEEEKTVLLPEKVVYAIKDPANVCTGNEPEVTAVIPTLGYFKINGEEYRWLVTNEIRSNKLSKQGKIIKLPKSLSLQNVMSQQNWYDLWSVSEKFENATKEEKENMTSCLIDAFNKLNKLQPPGI